jgi:hypothetical protein
MNWNPELLELVHSHNGNWDDPAVLARGRELWLVASNADETDKFSARYVVDRTHYFNSQLEVKKFVNAPGNQVQEIFRNGMSGLINGHSISINTKRIEV